MNQKTILPVLALCLLILLSTPLADKPKELSLFNDSNGEVIEMDAISVHSISSASGQGNTSTAVQHFSREVTGQTFTVTNSYASTAQHNGTVDLTQFHMAGWTLYRADMTIDNLTAIVEREVVGSIDQTQNFYIREDTLSNVTQLAQGFYAQPHDGLLLNYSVFHSTPTYNPSLYGDAYFVVRSDYALSSSNVTSPQALVYEGSSVWTTITALANLTGDSTYYALIDGNALQKSGPAFPMIIWNSESSTGAFQTRFYTRELNAWSQNQAYEALLNYTYVPWDQSSNLPMVFQPAEVSLRANGTPLSGNSVSWTSPTNISSIAFDSNQSVGIYHNLTLWYRKDVPAQSVWDVPVSGGDVMWNLTTVVSYPSQSQSRYLNLTKQDDWTTSGLYNGTDPTNHTTYLLDGNTVLVSSMGNGTWSLVSTAPNYVTGIISLDTVSITDNLLITNTIQDGTLTNATSGTTNLTIWDSTSVVYNPANQSVTNGATSYTWDIDLDTSNNGTYRIEVYWTNGTEAGYLTKEFVVFYPTTLTPADPTIDAFTDSTFEVRVDFDDTFTPKGIDGSYAGVIVQYSFDGGTWTGMTDLNNGTWTATISTTGYSAGTYQVRVNGSGSAIENQSITIDVTLTYDTLPLVVAWSNTDNISYIGNTNLTVQYSYANGTIVQNALVTVTDYTTTWTLQYDPAGFYWVQFNGTDGLGFATHALNISASRAEHVPRFDDTQALTIHKEPTSPLTVIWTPSNVTIIYTDSLNLQVDYAYGGGDVPSAVVNVTIDGVTYDLTYTGTVWNITIPGEDIGIGTYSASISAWSFGYVGQTNTTSGLNITIAPNTFYVDWISPSDLNATYFETVDISVIYTFDSLPIPGATVRLYVNTTTVYDFTYSATDERWHLTLDASAIGLGTWNATVMANKTGYDTGRQVDTLYIVIDSGSVTPSWTTTQIYYTHTQTLDVTVLDSFGQPITDALVNATYMSTDYVLAHVGAGVYQFLFDGQDGLGTYQMEVWTWRYGSINRTFTVTVEVIETPTSGQVITVIGGFDTQTIYYDGWVELRLTMQDTDSNYLPGMQVNLTTSTAVHPLTDLGNGTYTLNFTGSELGVTTLDGNISAYTHGYVVFKSEVSLTVEPIPTRLVFTENTIPDVLYLNQTVEITVEYVNDHTDGLIDPSGESFSWSGSALTYSEPVAGRFTFTISAVMLSLDTHTLTFTLSKENYSSQVIDTGIIVRALHTSLTSESTYTEYENETITFVVTFTDSDRDLPVYWGTVNVTIDGVSYQMSYSEGDETYYLDYHITNSPGVYVVAFSAVAEGCDEGTASAVLTVDEKGTPTLSVEYVGNVVRDAPIVIRATLLDGVQQPLEDETVEFVITVTFEDDHNLTVTLSRVTDSNGVAELSYVVPEEEGTATSVSVVVKYHGRRDLWPMSTSTLTREVIADPVGVMVIQILSLFYNPLFYLMLGGLIAGVLLAKRSRASRAKMFASKKAQYDYFNILASLRHFMIVYRGRGTCLFYHPFGESRIQADLISGFISAITSMYGEIKQNGEMGTLEEINYQGLILNSRVGENCLAILIGDSSITQEVRDRLQFFVELFESQYKNDLAKWTGLVDCFNPEWIVSNLYTVLNYQMMIPHTLNPSVKGEKDEMRVFKYVQASLGDQTEFEVKDYLAPVANLLNKSEMEVLDIFMSMAEKGIITPIGIHTILQRQGMGLTDVHDMELATTVPESEETTLDEEIEADTISEPDEAPAKKKPAKKRKKTEQKERVDPKDEFIAEVESLLKKDKKDDVSE